jgi:hypothetical protein
MVVPAAEHNQFASLGGSVLEDSTINNVARGKPIQPQRSPLPLVSYNCKHSMLTMSNYVSISFVYSFQYRCTFKSMKIWQQVAVKAEVKRLRQNIHRLI